MAKTVEEVLDRVEHLRNLHLPMRRDRTRVRDILDGGAAGIKALLGDAVDSNIGDVPAPNLMLSGLERLAQKIGRRPDLKIDPPPNRDSDRARRMADKRERIVEYYDAQSQMELQLMQVARWLPGYGFAVWVIRERLTAEGDPYPHAELRDPYDCYPGFWGPDQQPIEMAIARRVDPNNLAKIYGSYEAPTNSRDSNTRSFGASRPSGGWEGAMANGIDIIEYYDADGTWVVLPEDNQVLDFIPNPLGSGPRFVVPKRFSFSKLQGQYDQVISMMAAMAKLNVLSLIAMEDAVFTETNIEGDLESGDYQRGRFATNFLAPGSTVSKPPNNLPYQMFQQIDRVERQLRMVAGYPVTDDAQSPNSFVTGRGLEELGASVQLMVREYHTVLRYSIQSLDSKRLEWDEIMYGKRSKPMTGVRRGASFSETYEPARDIGGNYSTRRIFGVMAGWDEASKVVTGLQLLQGGIIDTQTMQENLDGLDNISRIRSRTRQNEAERVLLGSLEQMAATADPTAMLAMVEIYENPDNMPEILAKFFTPQEPQLSPEEEQFLGQGGAGGPGGPGGVGGPPEDVSTVLSRLESGGGIDAGVQTVGRL